uniref:CSON005823 protein n=1 Tax=Culicoides sonorensis TaxID=179676 RepID=A0A336M7K2_CULSO
MTMTSITQGTQPHLKVTSAQKEAIEVLHGLCISLKDPPTISQLIRDYVNIEGKQLDLNGFQSVEDLLLYSNKFNLVKLKGSTIVVAKLTSKTIHIVNMINRQKRRRKPKKKKPTTVVQPAYLPPLPSQLAKVVNIEVFKNVDPTSFRLDILTSQRKKRNKIIKIKTKTKKIPIINHLQPLPSKLMKVVNADDLKMVEPSKVNRKLLAQEVINSISTHTPYQKEQIRAPKKEIELKSHQISPMDLSRIESLGLKRESNQKNIVPTFHSQNLTSTDKLVSKLAGIQSINSIAVSDQIPRNINEKISTNEKSNYSSFDGRTFDLAVKMFHFVSEHKQGVFLDDIPVYFRKTHHFNISTNLIRVIIVTHESMFEIDYTGDREIVVASNRFMPDIIPPKLNLPWSDEYWNVIITLANSTTSIWCNILGPKHYDAYVDLHEAIQAEIDDLEYPYEIDVDKYYLAVIHDVAHRVRVIQVDHEHNKAYCNYIDTGDREWLGYDDIFVCHYKFLKFPGQAIQLSLEGLSIFGNLDSNDLKLSELNGKILIAKIHSTKQDYLKNGDGIHVTLYDTSTDVDINLNEDLIQKIRETLKYEPKLFDGFNLITITGVLYYGTITGYSKESSYFNLIEKEIDRITEDNMKLKRYQGLIKTDLNEIYLIYDIKSNQFQRAKLLSNDNEEHKIVKLIDYGTDLIVNRKTEIYSLKFISPGLQIIPPQAIPMRLHGVKGYRDEKITSLIREILRPDTNVLVKVKVVVKDVNYVEIFYRPANGSLRNLNDEINKEIS